MPPLNVGNAYARALSNAGAPPTPAASASIRTPLPDQGPSKGALPRIPPMVDPRSQKGDIYFLDPGMVPPDWEKLKAGDTIMLKATVVAPGGSKIGVSIDEVLSEGDEDKEEPQDEGFDTGSAPGGGQDEGVGGGAAPPGSEMA